jgi:very-short-patch-repair endonuclease
MTQTLQDKILSLLAKRPDQKADEIAKALGATRSEINQALYGPLRPLVRQDRAYRWGLAAGAHVAPPDAFPDTDLARLCRYYLACLGHDDTGVSVFLTPKSGPPDYSEVKIAPRPATDLAEEEAGRRMLERRRAERVRYELYYGYPIHIAHVRARSGSEERMVEPVMLFPIEQESSSGRLVVDLAFPIINQKPFQRFTSADRDALLNEMLQLEQELGLGEGHERPELDDLARRLQAIRPDWPWQEDMDPSRLALDRPPLSGLTEAGIHNRAVIIMAERSAFTQGLEKELRDLARAPEDTLAGTALGRWLKGAGASEDEVPCELAGPAILEVSLMNAEQSEAVARALNAPMTVITGPPGTGKSQLVTNLLVNAAWAGKRVLFASKNNKAVDVVETRTNALGPRPIVLRMGASQSFQTRLAEYVLALTSAGASAAERAEFEEASAQHRRLLAEQAGLAREAEALVRLRNEVDQAEQAAEEARHRLGKLLFAASVEMDRAAAAAALRQLRSSAVRADRDSASAFTKLLWPLMEGGRLKALAASLEKSRRVLAKAGIVLPAAEPRPDLAVIATAASEAGERLGDLDTAARYLSSLTRLSAARSLEAIGREQAGITEKIARHSEVIWKLWLRLQPSRLTADERQKIARYTSLSKMVIDAGAEGQLSRQAQSQYAAMLRQVSHLLPCWAVTSLSARGRIPFEPGVFDIVVFDEASQCDIASALPLLYRAKSVVVIGDPRQLGHISGLRKGHDQALLARHDLLTGYAHWAYTHQSLFGLAASQVSGDETLHLVDHHRCHGDIISFSNTEFYDGRLRIATRHDRLRRPDRSQPGIRWVDVSGRVSRPEAGGAINTAEAHAVVGALRELVLGEGYAGTLGVVTPFRAQANAIAQLVSRDAELSAVLAKREFLADTVHRFQGDERDVIFFSPVVAEGVSSGAIGFLRANGNLFNVAITRARAQLIVVGDIGACRACDVGYLSRFAEYAVGLSQTRRVEVSERAADPGPRYPAVARPELVSDWQRDFYAAAFSGGLQLTPQYAIEQHVADFLLVSGDRRLVVEIDHDHYHRNWTSELCRRNQIRNLRLFELGYDVMRFWVYEVRDDLAGCLERLKRWKSEA